MSKFLVILPNNLGDVIMATPVVEGLKAKEPDCSINFLVEDGYEAGIENNPFCDEIIKLPRKNIRDFGADHQWEKAADSLLSFIERIVASRYDGIFNLCQHDYMSYLVPLMKGKAIFGRHFLKEGNHAIDDPWSQYLYAIPFSRSSNALHASDVYRRIADVTHHESGYSIEIIDREKAWAVDFLRGRGVDLQNKIMIFQPGAAFPSKCWPIEHFISLGRKLVDKNWQIIVSGAPSEVPNARQIYQSIGKNCFLIAGETQLRQAISICALAKGCVTGDTALMHAASGLKVPVYALFGPTNPVETGPYGNGNWVLSARCAQRPCFNTYCAANECMRSVSPEVVFSCIENGSPPAIPSCDVYRTELNENGDFKLKAISPNAFAYYNEASASLTRKAFETGGVKMPVGGNEKEISLEASRQWLAAGGRMKSALANYLETRNNREIGEFEREKQSLICIKGIGEFWTALVNIRLNSLPLINALEGINRSVEVCDATMRQIRDAITD